MSDRWPGGIISGTAPVPTGGGAGDSAPGIWTMEQAAPYIATQNWPGTGIPDPQFQYVTALLHGDGTNGGQNNTFLDSSPNNFSITRNGNTTQGSFSPYGNLWSTNGDANGNYFTSGTSSALGFGTGDFTVEFFIFVSRFIDNQFVIDFRPAGSGGATQPVLWVTTAGALIYFTAGSVRITSANGAVPLGVWTHVAITRSSGTTRVFANGVQFGSFSDSFDYGSSARFVNGTYGDAPGATNNNGGAISGYISNLRILKGTALYTGSYTVPTEPLTAITNTSCLTFQSNRFIDNSSNAIAITPTGSPSVQRFSPFQNLATYQPAVIGGSGYFDGTGDYLTVANSSAYSLDGDFTIQGWFNGPNYGTTIVFFHMGDSSSMIEMWVSTASATLRALVGSTTMVSSSSMIPNQWTHFALVRSGTGTNNISLYANGVRQAQMSSNITFTGTTNNGITIGAEYPSGSPWNGYLSNIQIIKGTAKYSGTTYTVPTTPFTNESGTQFLTNFTNGAIFDSDASNNIETVGNAQISTSVVKYGTGSMAFDGTGDYLVPSSPGNNQNFVFGTANFTVEFWVYFNSGLGSDIVLYDSRPLSTNGVYPTLYVNSSSRLSYVVSAADRITSGSPFVTGTWYHVALSRAGSSTRMFINGNQVGSTYADTNSYLNPARRPVIAINGFNETAAPLNGYIDDFRITNGYARYWFDFQPPTRAFPNYGGVIAEPAEDPLFENVTLLLNGNGTNGAQNNTFLDSSTNNFSITRNGNTTQGSFSPYGSNWSVSGNNGAGGLTAPNNSAFAFGTGDFTMECFYQNASPGPAPNIIGTEWFGPNLANKWMFLVGNSSSGEIAIAGITDSGGTQAIIISSGPTSANNGQWHHIAVTRSGTTVRAFLDGNLVGTSTSSFNFQMPNSTLLYLGQYFNPGDGSRLYNTGFLSNIRINKGTALYTASFTPPTGNLTAVSGTVLLTCQNNRFIDNSSNAFAISTNGTPQISRFSPFEPTAPYSTSVIGGSGYFDGTGDYLSIARNSAFTPTGDFTYELWVYPTGTPDATHGAWLGGLGESGDGSQFSWTLKILNNLTLTFYVRSTNVDHLTTATVKLNQWNYIAVSRQGTGSNNLLITLNGQNQTYSDSGSLVGSGTPQFTIGADTNGDEAFLIGWVSGARFINGTGYTSIPIPTTPPTAITNTALLVNFTNAGIPDLAMINNLETVGNAQVSTAQSKFGGSSLLFNGSSDVLVPPSNPIYAFGTGNFTVEAWVYLNASQEQFVFDTRSSASTAGFGCRIGSDNRLYYSDSANNALTSTAITNGTWTHVAWVRNGTTLTGYINGVNGGTATNSNNITQTNGVVGRVGFSGSGYFNGYIQDLRVTRGIARYVQPFTPPTQAFQTY